MGQRMRKVLKWAVIAGLAYAIYKSGCVRDCKSHFGWKPEPESRAEYVVIDRKKHGNGGVVACPKEGYATKGLAVRTEDPRKDPIEARNGFRITEEPSVMPAWLGGKNTVTGEVDILVRLSNSMAVQLRFENVEVPEAKAEQWRAHCGEKAGLASRVWRWIKHAVSPPNNPKKPEYMNSDKVFAKPEKEGSTKLKVGEECGIHKGDTTPGEWQRIESKLANRSSEQLTAYLDSNAKENGIYSSAIIAAITRALPRILGEPKEVAGLRWKEEYDEKKNRFYIVVDEGLHKGKKISLSYDVTLVVRTTDDKTFMLPMKICYPFYKTEEKGNQKTKTLNCFVLVEDCRTNPSTVQQPDTKKKTKQGTVKKNPPKQQPKSAEVVLNPYAFCQ